MNRKTENRISHNVSRQNFAVSAAAQSNYKKNLTAKKNLFFLPSQVQTLNEQTNQKNMRKKSLVKSGENEMKK